MSRSVASGEQAEAGRRIIYLTQLFDPEPTFKGNDFVKALLERGLPVEVVTGFPNYPGGKVYAGYNVRWRTEELLGGTRITRLAMYPSHDRSAFRRALCYLSFLASSLLHLLWRSPKPSLIYAGYPSLTVGFAAVVVSTIRRVPVIIDVQDLWPESLSASGMMKSHRVLAIIRWISDFTYRRCQHIIVLSQGFKAALTARGVDPAKITVLENWADESESGLPGESAKDDEFKVLYAGNIGAAQDLDVIVTAAAAAAVQLPQARFLIMGDGVEKERLTQTVRQRELSNVVFLPRVPLAEVGRHLQAADALLVHLRDEPIFRITIPSKTQAYLLAGKPILMGVQGDAADIVVKAGAGYTFRPSDSGDLIRKLRQLIELDPESRARMGGNGRAYYWKHLSKARAIGKTAEIIQATARSA